MSWPKPTALLPPTESVATTEYGPAADALIDLPVSLVDQQVRVAAGAAGAVGGELLRLTLIDCCRGGVTLAARQRIDRERGRGRLRSSCEFVKTA